jgi:hypothetical protein
MWHVRRTARHWALAAALLFALPLGAAAQGISAPELKAAFLANFSNFTEWPEGALPPGQSFVYCVLDDKAVAAALTVILGHPGQTLQPWVRVVKIEPSIRSCQVLYVGKLDGKQSTQVFDILKDSPVFTVGDAEHFAESGGIAQFMLADGRMRFAINVAAAKRAHLVLSSKLLSLATLVKDAGQ